MKSELETLVSSNTYTNAHDETAQEINSLLRSGIEAAKNGNREEAKALLFRVTDIDPQNEMAWLWLASVSEYPEELLTFLQKVLHLNPNNEQALEWERSTKALLARNLVQYGITAVQENKKESAKRCFLRALETDENNEMAWLWLASITDVPEEKVANLEKVLAINPNNEVANTLLKLLHKDEAQELLQKSKASAVHGNRQEALEMLEQVKQLDAELDEVWILQAHLSESFEEKAFCFNQALACNPANEVARVGLASLESILHAVNGNGNGNGHGANNSLSLELMEEVKTSEMGFVAETEEAAAFETGFAAESEEIVEEPFTGELSEPEEASAFADESAFVEENEDTFMSFARESGEMEEMFFEPKNAAPSEETEEEAPDTAHFDEELSEVPAPEEVTEEEPAALYFEEADEDAQPAENNFSENSFVLSEENEPEYSAPPEETAEAGEVTEEVKAQTFYFGQEEEETEASFENAVSFEDKEAAAPAAETAEFAPAEEAFATAEEVNEAVNMPEEANEDKSLAQMFVCPFCATENNINDEVCDGCHAVLGLHNIDLLLSQQEADKEELSEAIENMEANLESDTFSAEEYFNLGLACLNLKDFDSGLKYLQKSYILNPTNSFLKSQIDELTKRMDNNENHQENSMETAVASKTIMVVDDSATIRKLVSAKLEKHGHNVVTAVDGMDALAKLEEIVPDLILLDITMPRLDGYQVCKLIRANDNTRFVPVVLISGKDGFFDKVRGKMCGSTTYITKPFGPEMLLRTVEGYFQ
jgi:CheY-like chemotaxis protein